MARVLMIQPNFGGLAACYEYLDKFIDVCIFSSPSVLNQQVLFECFTGDAKGACERENDRAIAETKHAEIQAPTLRHRQPASSRTEESFSVSTHRKN